MSRDLSAEVAAAIAAPVVIPVLLIEGQFIGGRLNWWTGVGDLAWDDKTWTGMGDLLGISEVEETDEIKAGGVTFSLSSVKTAKRSLALAEMQRGQPGKVWLGLLDAVGAVIPSPRILFRGRLDTCMVQDSDDGETSTLALSYEHELIDLERPRQVRYTDQEQKRRFAGDRGLEGVAALKEALVPWGFRA